MLGDINVVNAEPVIKALQDWANGKVHLAEISAKDIEFKQTDTEPLEGYEMPKDFPYCCESHKQIFQAGADWLAKFPNCCEAHARLNKAKWFNKNNYSYLPLKLVTTVVYTFHCISKCIDNPNWYNEITHYIDYTKQSYGQLPEGFGAPVGVELYLHNVEMNIEIIKEIPEEKRSRLIKYIKDYNNKEVPAEQTDVNLLIDTYKRWLKDFPFEISFFTPLKPFFENQTPILKGKTGENIYTGLVAHKLQTQKGLVKFLISTTQSILAEINTLSLCEQGQIMDIQKARFEILNADRRLKLKVLEAMPLDDRKQYIKVLKQWFKDEKQYLKDLKEISIVKPIQTENKGQMNFSGIIYNGIKNIENKKDLKAYFIREFKKAQRDHFYTLENFFTPLFSLIDTYKKEIAEKFASSQRWYENVISKAEKNELDFYDYYYTRCLDKQGIYYEGFKTQENKREFEERKKEFREFSIEMVSTQNGTYKLSEIRQIEDALKQAENGLQHQYINEANKSKFDYWQILKSNFNEELSKTALLQPTENASHREVIIAHNFKVKAGLKGENSPAQWKTERGEKARQAYYTTLKQSDNYRAPTEKELQKVIQLLNDLPQAQKMAINELEALQSL